MNRSSLVSALNRFASAAAALGLAALALTFAVSGEETTDPTSSTADAAGAPRTPAPPDVLAARAGPPATETDDRLVETHTEDRTQGSPPGEQDVGPAYRTEIAASYPPQTSSEPAVPDRPAPSDPAVLEQCRERYVIAPGVEEQVRARVPDQFRLRYNSNGQPLLYITAIHCERYTANGVTQQTTAAAFGVSIESPDGTMCATPWPAVGAAAPYLAGSCNNYLIFAAYDNPTMVAWARAGTPDAPVYFVDDLTFTEGGLDPVSLGVPLRFDSGSTPSAYQLDLVVRARPVTVPLAAAFWFESRVGTVRVGFDTEAIALGEATGQLTVEPGSEMAAMLGTATPRSQQPFPLLAGNRWEHATLTKTVIPAAGEVADEPQPTPPPGCKDWRSSSPGQKPQWGSSRDGRAAWNGSRGSQCGDVRQTEVCFTVHVPTDPRDHQVSGTIFHTRPVGTHTPHYLLTTSHGDAGGVNGQR